MEKTTLPNPDPNSLETSKKTSDTMSSLTETKITPPGNSSDQPDFKKDPNISLREKWRMHLEEKKKAGRKPTFNPDPTFLNRWGPPVTLFVAFGAVIWGVIYATPTLYEEYGWEEWLWTSQFLAIFMAIEALANMFLCRVVTSAYQPAIHGTKPSDFPVINHAGTISEKSNSGRVISENPRGAENLRHPSSENSARVSEKSDWAASENNSLLLSACGENNGSMPPMTVQLIQRDAANFQDSGVSKRSSVIMEAASNYPTDGEVAIGGSISSSSRSGNANTFKMVAKSDTRKSSDNDAAVDLDYAPPDPSNKDGTYDGYSFRMFVATSLPTPDGKVERKAYPYWSWVPCLMCQRLRPPRCHHCTLCRHCVLKRDHHCFISGACVGVNNQRFFIVFTFWTMLLTWFGSLHMLPYTFQHVVPDYDISYVDFIPPVALLRGLLGYVSLVIAFLGTLFWFVLFFTLFSTGTFFQYTAYMLQGATSFERAFKIKVTDTRPLSGRLRSVFGDYWWLNFVLPTYPWIRPAEDAVLWPHLKPC